MKALIVGYGSIGQRHQRLLQSIGFETAVVTSQTITEIKKFSSVSEALQRWSPSYVVIASPTSRHSTDLASLTQSQFEGICLIEKPLFHMPQEVPDRFAFSLAVGYNLRYLPAIQYIHEITKSEKILSAHFCSGEYLPDWRPGRDYRKTSSAQQSSGGGVLRDLSHEIDFIHYLLGAPMNLVSEVSRTGLLEIDTEDSVQALLHHETGCTTTLALSYLSRIRRREIAMTTATKSIYCNLLSGEVIDNHVIKQFSADRDATFVEMHNDVSSGQLSIACSFKEGANVVRTIEMIEQSHEQKVWVTR